MVRSASGLNAAILSDGMGGMRDGAQAAIVATAAMAVRCASATGGAQAVLAEALHFANEQVFRALRGEGGAAVVAVGWFEGAWFVVHAGDARAYHLDSSGPPVRVTVDDTVQAQLENMGRMAERSGPAERRLLQFVGMGKDFEPHVSSVAARGRGLILTSDGAHAMPSAVFDWVAASAGHLQMLTERLVTASE
ncbi:MAG: PP2C family serine/threonine-protein phosphatase [Vicinamibacterales bacterium]